MKLQTKIYKRCGLLLLAFVISLGMMMPQQVMARNPGKALNFDGPNSGALADYVTIGNLGTVDDWTIELWFKPKGLTNYENLFHSHDIAGNLGVRLELSQNYFAGHLYVSVSGTNISTPTTIVPPGGTLTLLELCCLALLGISTGTMQAQPLNIWTANGPNSSSVNALAIDFQNLDKIYAGTFGGGVFKSSNGLFLTIETHPDTELFELKQLQAGLLRIKPSQILLSLI